MRLRAALEVAAVLVIALAAPAVAGCSLKEAPAKDAYVETGTGSGQLTKGRGTWTENYALAVVRDGNRRSVYGRVASDQRFGVTDTDYETGIYLAASPHAILDVTGAFSPQHQTLPHSVVGAAVDLRTNAGYGYQIQYSGRAYTAVNAGTATIGMDRYFRDRRIALSVSVAQLSNVPGDALSAGLAYARYLPCDAETFSFSSGRDVESSGLGPAVAVFHTYSYDLNDVHWISNRFAVNAGAGWYLLNGAYNRFEVRLAVRDRI